MMTEVSGQRFFPGVFPQKEGAPAILTRSPAVGDRFGRWTVTGKSASKRNYISVICECGTQRDVYKGQLIRGNTLSCGCLHRELSSARRKGLPSPNAGRVLSTEERENIAKHNRERWASGSFDTPAVREHLARLHEAQGGTPETGVNAKGPENHKAKHWRLLSPDGSLLDGMNLDHLIRENSHLFSPADLKYRVNKFGTESSCNAYRQLAVVGRGKRPSWKGWTRA